MGGGALGLDERAFGPYQGVGRAAVVCGDRSPQLAGPPFGALRDLKQLSLLGEVHRRLGLAPGVGGTGMAPEICGMIPVPMRDEFRGRDCFVERAEEARRRADEARQAADRARARVADLRGGRLDGSIGAAEAEERRLLAEHRLADLEASLADARQRSVNAHERAARLDQSAGRIADARRHYDAADVERQLIEDEAVKVANRHDGGVSAGRAADQDDPWPS